MSSPFLVKLIFPISSPLKCRCILNGACTVPNCLYGLYNRTGGGCPTAVQRDIDWIEFCLDPDVYPTHVDCTQEHVHVPFNFRSMANAKQREITECSLYSKVLVKKLWKLNEYIFEILNCDIMCYVILRHLYLYMGRGEMTKLCQCVCGAKCLFWSEAYVELINFVYVFILIFYKN